MEKAIFEFLTKIVEQVFRKSWKVHLPNAKQTPYSIEFLRQFKGDENFSFMYRVVEGNILMIRMNEKNLDNSH
jgi:hypothetical protein